MKKLLVLMMSMVMILSITACGGDDTTEPVQGSSEEKINNSTASEVEFASMDFGYITMSVPNVFSAVTEQEGVYISSGPQASISVTPTLEIDILPSEWDESLAEEALEMFYGATYTDLELSAFEGNVNMNGNTAVYYAFYGKNDKGVERLVHVIRLYNADHTAQYMVTVIHTEADDFFTPELMLEIINSITLSPEAQNLTSEFEG